jgi:hypothetical protein
MHPFLRTRLCRAVSLITALLLGASSCLSGASVAFAAGVAPSAPPAGLSATAPPMPASVEPAARATEVAPPEPTVVAEIESLRTENATHYQLSNGNVRAVIAQSPVRFRDASGSWRAIDTNLAPADSFGGVRTVSTKLQVRIGAQKAGAAPVQVLGDGYSVGIDLLGASEDSKLVVGDSAAYLGVARDTDLGY